MGINSRNPEFPRPSKIVRPLSLMVVKMFERTSRALGFLGLVSAMLSVSEKGSRLHFTSLLTFCCSNHKQDQAPAPMSTSE